MRFYKFANDRDQSVLIVVIVENSDCHRVAGNFCHCRKASDFRMRVYGDEREEEREEYKREQNGCGEVRPATIRTKLYPVIRWVSARGGGGGTEKIPGRANKLNTASEMTAGVLFIHPRERARARPLSMVPTTAALMCSTTVHPRRHSLSLSRSLYNAITLLGGWHPV